MTMRASIAVTLVVIVGLAGCIAVTPPATETTADDGIGVVDGVTYNESVDVGENGTVDRAAVDTVVRRSMARIERERGLDFERVPEVEVITRAEFRERDVGFGGSADRFERVRWRTTHILGADEDVDEALSALYGGTVQGYYSSSDGGRIVLIVENSNDVRIPRATLVHELVHALQDQRRTLSFSSSTTDERFARQGLTEGEADLLTFEYEQQCTSGAWRCVPGPDEGNGSGAQYNRGLFVSVFVGYGEGPSFVAYHRDRGGWDAVDDLYDDPPTSTAELIEPERYPFEPRTVRVPDRSSSDWEPIERDGTRRNDTLGPAALYAMFWHQGVIDRDRFRETNSPSGVTYQHPLVTGWTGDRLVAYERDTETAAVYRTTWTNATEARRFADGYRTLLDDLGATRVENRTYRVPDGGFAGGYRIDRTGDAVTIVQAPSVDALDAVHPRSDATTTGRRAAPEQYSRGEALQSA